MSRISWLDFAKDYLFALNSFHCWIQIQACSQRNVCATQQELSGDAWNHKHGCLEYRTGGHVQITYLRSISSYYSMEYWRNWWHLLQLFWSLMSFTFRAWSTGLFPANCLNIQSAWMLLIGVVSHITTTIFLVFILLKLKSLTFHFFERLVSIPPSAHLCLQWGSE